MLLNQGLIEDVLIQYINVIGRVKVDWNKRAEMLDVSPNDPEYPVTVGVKDVTDSSASILSLFARSQADCPVGQRTETIHARYIVACDGSHSWTREQLHVPMETHSDESTWGVIDIEPITNFRMPQPPLSSLSW